MNNTFHKYNRIQGNTNCLWHVKMWKLFTSRTFRKYRCYKKYVWHLVTNLLSLSNFLRVSFHDEMHLGISTNVLTLKLGELKIKVQQWICFNHLILWDTSMYSRFRYLAGIGMEAEAFCHTSNALYTCATTIKHFNAPKVVCYNVI